MVHRRPLHTADHPSHPFHPRHHHRKCHIRLDLQSLLNFPSLTPIERPTQATTPKRRLRSLHRSILHCLAKREFMPMHTTIESCGHNIQEDLQRTMSNIFLWRPSILIGVP